MSRPHASRRPRSPAGEEFPSARRALGQNFLVDPRAVDRIVASATSLAGSPLLELGPGRGALTEVLARRARLVAVEKDHVLASRLAARFPPDRVVVIEGDMLRFPFAEAAARLEAPPGTRVRIMGNLPYNISKPIALKLVREREAVEEAVLMFQREVAARLTASPGGKDYGPLSVVAGLAFRVEALFDLPAGAFRPAPKVTSTVTRWTPRAADDLPRAIEAPLMRVLAVTFARRRRTILGNLRDAPELAPEGGKTALALLESIGIDPKVRAEAVSPASFLALARAWPQRGAC